MEDEGDTDGAQEKFKYRRASSENLHEKVKLLRRRRHIKLTENFLVPLKLPFESPVMSKGDFVVDTMYGFNLKRILSRADGREKALNYKPAQANISCYKKVNQDIIEAYYNECAKRNCGVTQFVNKSYSENLTPRIENLVRTQHSQENNPYKTETIRRKSPRLKPLICQDNVESLSDNFLECPDEKCNESKYEAAGSSSDASDCQLCYYNNKNNKFNTKNDSVIASQYLNTTQENNDSCEPHTQYHSAISVDCSLDNEIMYGQEIPQNLVDDYSDMRTDDETYPNSEYENSSIEATQTLDVAICPHLLFKNGKHFQVNQELTLSDIPIKAVKSGRDQFTESNTNDGCLINHNDTSKYPKQLIACTIRTMPPTAKNKSEMENKKEHIVETTDNLQRLDCHRTMPEISTQTEEAIAMNESLQSRIQELKQKIPSNSSIQALIEICGTQSHIAEVLRRKETKFQRIDPKLRTIRKSDDDIKITNDDDSNEIFKLPENVLEKSLMTEIKFQKLIDEFVGTDNNSSVKKYKAALQHEIETECEAQPLSIRQFKQQLDSSSLFLKMSKEIENSRRYIYEAHFNMEKHFRDLDQAINIIKRDITQLLCDEEMAVYERRDRELQKVPLDYEQLYKRFKELESKSPQSNSKVKSVKSRVIGGGFAFSFILLLCLMCGSLVTNYWK